MTSRRIEDGIHKSILAYLEVALPNAVVIHVPNQGKRGIVEAVALKAMGVKAGVPDLIIFMKDGRTAFVEVKAPRGILSTAQTDFLARMKSFGHLIAVVRSVSDMSDRLIEWGLASRARAA